jgi:hypothetical protein
MLESLDVDEIPIDQFFVDNGIGNRFSSMKHFSVHLLPGARRYLPRVIWTLENFPLSCQLLQSLQLSNCSNRLSSFSNILAAHGSALRKLNL